MHHASAAVNTVAAMVAGAVLATAVVLLAKQLDVISDQLPGARRSRDQQPDDGRDDGPGDAQVER